MYVRNRAKEKEHIDFLRRTKYLPEYQAFISVYPFGLEDLEGEVWKWIKNYEGLYQISNYGRIKSFFARIGNQSFLCSKGKLILRPRLAMNGYLLITLNKNGKRKNFQIHQLVAQGFIPNPENKSTVNHKDGDKFNDCVSNLEWQTQSENNQHAVKNGLIKIGADCISSKLTSRPVRYIRENYIPRDSEFGGAALAKKFNVNPATISNVILGITYKNVDSDKGDEHIE